MEILRCENVTKIYDNGETQLKALDNVSLSVERVNLWQLSAHQAQANPHFFIS